MINAVYSTSDYYAPCAGVSIESLLINNKDCELEVYILGVDLSEENIKKFKEIENKYKTNINIIDAKKTLELKGKQLKLPLMRGGYNTYSRIMLNEWFSDLDKLIVIDSDTLVTGSLSDIYYEDMGEYLMFAVPELAVYSPYQTMEKKSLIKELPLYFNMGIVLVNMKKWNKDNIDEFLAKKIIEETEEFKIADQTIINKYLNDYIKKIDLKYNFYTPAHNVKYSTIAEIFSEKSVISKEELYIAQKSPIIIHFFGMPYERPWYKRCATPYKGLYKKYKLVSVFNEDYINNWPKSKNFIFFIYDLICFAILFFRKNDYLLKFRYHYGQKIKSLLNQDRRAE